MAWDASGYDYRRKITIDHTKVENDLEDFPILISTTTASLKDTSNGGHMESASGYDTKFYLDNGTELYHEIDTYDNSTGTFIAWVKIPNLSDSEDTTLYLYYGKSGISTDPSSASVWDDDYIAVYHMNDNTSSTIKDSTSNDNDATKKGSNEPSEVTGKIGNGQSFDGSDDYIKTDSNLFDIGTGDITISCWFKTDTVSDWGYILCNKDDFDNSFLRVGFNQSGCLRMYAEDEYGSHNDVNTTSDYDDNTWRHVVFTRDGSTGEIFVNGSTVPTTGSLKSGDIGTSDYWWIGQNGSNNNYFVGLLDEIRVSNTLRSAAWIKTEYNTSNSPSTFFTLGSEEESGETHEPTDTANADDSLAFVAGKNLSDTASADDTPSYSKGYSDSLDDTAKASDLASYSKGWGAELDDIAGASDLIDYIYGKSITLDDTAKASDDVNYSYGGVVTRDVPTFTLHGESSDIIFPKPDWDTPKNKVDNSTTVFNFWDEDIDTVNRGINSIPMTLAGTISLLDSALWINRAAMTTWLNSIKTAMNDGEQFEITDLKEGLNGVYIIKKFSFSTIKGFKDSFKWSLELELVRDSEVE